MLFKSKIDIRGDFRKEWPEETVKNEPMFFNSTLEFAYRNGGEITKEFIDNLPFDWRYCNAVLDSRVHMLMKNWYPCIPGWHHDDVPRTTFTGQPNYENPEYHSEHLCGLVNGDICPTKYLLGDIELSEPNIETLQYNVWHNELESKMKIDDTILRYSAESGKYIQFDCDTFHSGDKAVGNGWRWFIRLSRQTDRQQRVTNEIRRQVQTYLEFPMEGW